MNSTVATSQGRKRLTVCAEVAVRDAMREVDDACRYFAFRRRNGPPAFAAGRL